jgi:hypothetical protein
MGSRDAPLEVLSVAFHRVPPVDCAFCVSRRLSMVRMRGRRR